VLADLTNNRDRKRDIFSGDVHKRNDRDTCREIALIDAKDYDEKEGYYYSY
jgi:hypothetical protein